jgi:O-antigen/teichoic acid export membrane protein
MPTRQLEIPDLAPRAESVAAAAAPADAEAPTSYPIRAGNRSMAIALADQGVVSLGNFLTNILLARSLPVAHYGVFALFLDAILFLNSLQAALLIYPLTVRCASMDDQKLRRTAGASVILTLLLALPLGTALAIYGSVIGAGSVVIWAVLGQTLWQCQETLRRTMLARRNYRRALLGDSISYLGQVTIIALLVMHQQADVSRAFMAMAITSLIAALVQGVQLEVRPVGFDVLLRTGRNFWLAGRWVMVASLTNLVTTVCCSYTLARSHGDAAMGQYAAISNLLRIANPLFITLATLIVPAITLVAPNDQGPSTLRAAWRAGWHYGLRGAALLVPYWSILLIIPLHAIRLLYPHRGEFDSLSNDLRLFVGVSITTLLNAVLISIFNGLRRNRRALIAQAGGVVACAALTLPLTFHFGLRGLLIGTLISNLTVAGAMGYLFWTLRGAAIREFSGDS